MSIILNPALAYGLAAVALAIAALVVRSAVRRVQAANAYASIKQREAERATVAQAVAQQARDEWQKAYHARAQGGKRDWRDSHLETRVADSERPTLVKKP